MSEINDALKRARQATSSAAPEIVPLRPPSIKASSLPFGWGIPLFIVVLIFTAIFFIGWAMTHRRVRHEVVQASVAPAAQPASFKKTEFQAEAVLSAPISKNVVPPTPAVAPVLAKPLPKLQGIFYSPAAPTAILDGKTVAPGDQFGEYRVREILEEAVWLTDAGGKQIKISLNH